MSDGREQDQPNPFAGLGTAWESAGPGRPRKTVPGRNSLPTKTWKDLGFTRRFVFECRRLAEVPEDEWERIMALPYREKTSVIRRIKSGQWRLNAVDSDAHVRLPRELFDALAGHAKHQGKSVSDLVVELINIALDEIIGGQP
jgi:hypothetical protein